MSGVTSFGKLLRKLRVDHGSTLRKMAEDLGISSGYLSAIELGKRAVPSDMIYKLQNCYDLTTEALEEMRQLVETEAKSIQVNLEDANNKQKEVFLAFARQFDDLDESALDDVLNVLKSRGN
ncbi:helix-turn-helix transcriptional regulator [Wohlfahrtiimonas sp. G9077]|uniref:helix-turn-helix domain-containing protein n=1 Tax=Wohlfahrtiimonas sp. G9077 TaxID=1980118 RepID=UPI000B999881|nr:helix-turn-helix transcriptional regulator [Wohlfahrtiimonas sp. G9077]OYQ75514.1 hypothetical protein B9T20_02095 [Wohlfahrtiimonas sp. G9077]